MRFSPEQVSELTAQVSGEGHPRVLLAPIQTLPAGVILPKGWEELLTRDDANLRVGETLWGPGVDTLPRVVGTLDKVAQSIGLLLTDLKRPSLLYIFTKEEEVFARRGHSPLSKLPVIGAKLPVDLSSIYGIHDGWVDLFSGDSGPLPSDEWRVVGRSESEGEAGFLEVFNTGGNALGFDLSDDPPGSYVVWSDGDVEAVDNFWARLDSWIADELQEMDPNTV